MGGLQKILLLLVVLFVILVVLIFSMNNQVSVALNFLVYETQPRGVALWLILSFVCGAVIGILLTSLTLIRQGISKKHLERRLEKAEKELEKSRNAEPQVI